jgi:mono/diheme cytochrome c family protein
MTIMHTLPRLLIFLGALLGMASVALAEESALAKGQRLIEVNCTRCHAIGTTGDSPFAPAPPFREVAKNYTPEELVDGFMEGLAVRHQAMPDWSMTMDQAEAIATYIMDLKRMGEVKTGDSPAAIGYEILLKNCARCHAIDTTGESPLAKAPQFREVMKRYDPSNLEEALAEGIVTGHNEMPEFTFEPDQIGAIVAYLSTLQDK